MNVRGQTREGGAETDPPAGRPTADPRPTDAVLSPDGGLNDILARVNAALGPLAGDAGTAASAVGPRLDFFHGCAGLLQSEIYVSDCSRQFVCGHAPGQL